jgi:hypothetical protein
MRETAFRWIGSPGTATTMSLTRAARPETSGRIALPLGAVAMIARARTHTLEDPGGVVDGRIDVEVGAQISRESLQTRKTRKREEFQTRTHSGADAVADKTLRPEESTTRRDSAQAGARVSPAAR